MTKEHLIRLSMIFLLCAGLGAAWMFGKLEPALKSQIEGALLVLFPALMDSLQVGQRQRAQTKRESVRPKASPDAPAA